MKPSMTERERIVRTLQGEPCDKIPWATRLDIWYTAVRRSRTLPAEFTDMDLKFSPHSIARNIAILGKVYGIYQSGASIRKSTSP